MKSRIKVGAAGTIEQWELPDVDTSKAPLDAGGKFDAQEQAKALAVCGITPSGNDDGGTVAYMTETLRVMNEIICGWKHDSDQKKLEGAVSKRVTSNVDAGQYATVTIGIDNRPVRGYRVSVSVDLNGLAPESFTAESAKNCAVLSASVLCMIGERHAGGRWYFTQPSAAYFAIAASSLKDERGVK